eukprot:1758177-Amphidinium_carterae.1
MPSASAWFANNPKLSRPCTFGAKTNTILKSWECLALQMVHWPLLSKAFVLNFSAHSAQPRGSCLQQQGSCSRVTALTVLSFYTL